MARRYGAACATGLTTRGRGRRGGGFSTACTIGRRCPRRRAARARPRRRRRPWLWSPPNRTSANSSVLTMPGATSSTRIGSPFELEAQHRDERVRGELRGVVAAAALVGRVAGDRGDVDDVGDPALDGAVAQQGQQRARDALSASTLTSNIHAQSSIVRRLDGVEPVRAAGIVHERVHSPGRGELIAQAVDVGLRVRSATKTDAPVSASSSRGGPRVGRRRRRPSRRARSARTVAAPIPELAPVTTARSTLMRPFCRDRSPRRVGAGSGPAAHRR